MKTEQIVQLRQIQYPAQIISQTYLEMNDAELINELKKEADDNPFLEFDELEDQNEKNPELKEIEKIYSENEENFLTSNEITEDDVEYTMSNNYYDYGEEEPPKINPKAGADPSYKEDLIEIIEKQLFLLDLSDKEKEVAKLLCGELDSKGFLKINPHAFLYKLEVYHNIKMDIDELKSLIKKLQTLEPPGIFATSLKEYIIIQLKAQKKTSLHETAIKIVENDLRHLTTKNYPYLMKKYSLDKNKMKKILHIISSLNANPLSNTNIKAEIPSPIKPDFSLYIEENDKFLIHINYAPPLKINMDLMRAIKQIGNNKDPKLYEYYKAAMEKAKVIYNAVLGREKTLRNIITAIVEWQKDFFLTGDKTKIKSMKLKDIAQITGYDLSTISRVTSKRYIETPFGIIPLKSLFSDSVEKNEKIEDKSVLALKEIIKDIINNENPQKPYTDQQITQILNQKGYKIARRTVAKYRDALGILPAKMRRKI